MNNFAQGFAIIFHGGSLSKVDFDKSVNSSYQLENHRLKCAKNILRYRLFSAADLGARLLDDCGLFLWLQLFLECRAATV